MSYIVYKVSIQSGVHPVRFAAFMPSCEASPEIPLLKRPYALFLLTNCKRPALSGLTMSQSGGVFSPFSSLFQAFFRRFRHVSCCYSFLNKNVTYGILHYGIASYTIANPVTVPNRLKIVAGKLGSKEKSRTFAIPFEKRVSERTGSS